MGVASIASMCLAAIACYVGLSYLVQYLLARGRAPQDLAFSLMCFSAVANDIASSRIYAAATAQEAAPWQGVQVVALCLLGIFFLQFAAHFTARKFRLIDKVCTAFFLLGIALAVVNPLGLMWSEVPVVQTTSFLGHDIVYRKMGSGIGRIMQSGGAMLVLIYIAWRLATYGRAGHRRETRPVLVGFSVMALGVINDAAVSHQVYDFFYVIEYAYMFMILCMAFAMHRSQAFIAQELMNSEGRYRSFLNHFQGIAFRASLNYKPFFFHGAVAEMTGYNESEFLDGTVAWLDLVVPEDRERLADVMAALSVVPSDTIEREYRIQRKDGEIRWVKERVHAIRHDALKDNRIQGVFYDLTAQKTAEEDHKRLAAAVDAAAESIIITDADHRVLYVNPAFEALSGFRREEMIGKTPSILKSGKHKPAFYHELDETLAAGKIWRGRFTNRMKDGSLYEEEAVISPVRNDSGDIVNYVAVKRDVTHETLLESELRQSQKMDAIGKLAGRVAHDFTNILVIIQGNIGLIQEKIPRDPETDECLDSIVEASNRACQLTSQLLAFSHRQAMSLRSMDLNKAVSGGVEEMLSRTLGDNVHVVTHVADGACTIKGDPDHIEQVIVHLSVNACDAMPSGGTLTIETMRMILEADEIPQVCPGCAMDELVSTGYAVLWISDSGCGIPRDVKPHIFEPFYTTKGGAGVSSGLGLSTVYGIVEQHHGFLALHSEEGKGSSFAVFIPLVGRGMKEVQAREQQATVPTGSETVLVIGKPGLASSLLSKILKSLSYSVLEAQDIDKAVLLARRHAGTIDLLVVDRAAAMPSFVLGLNEIKTGHPMLKALFTSGFPRKHLLETGDITQEDVLVYRPYRRHEVAVAVRSVLDGQPFDA